MQLTLIGRVTTDNTLTTKMKAVITDKLTVKAQTQVSVATRDYVILLWRIFILLTKCGFSYLLFQLIDESRLFDTLVSFEYMVSKFISI